MSTPNLHLKALERSADIAMRSALAARQRLTVARRSAGVIDPLGFVTRAEHRKILNAERAAHAAEIAERDRTTRILLATASGMTSHPDYPEIATYSALASKLWPLARTWKSKGGDIKEMSLADEVIRAGQVRRGERSGKVAPTQQSRGLRATPDAILAAAKKARDGR